jgi:drug/metabolite transporter (DMT)-like permease
MTALAAIVILAEPFTNRLLVATVLVCSGVALTLVRPRTARRA